MASSYCNQPPLSVDNQICLLKSNGMSFDDEHKAKHLLQNISMFRMQSYMKPFMLDGTPQFKAGTTFEEAYTLYKFDSEFRKMVCSELEKIEISIRTQLSMIMSDAAGIYWFADVANFSDASRHAKQLNILKEELRRSDDDDVVQFRKSHAGMFPPSWMTFEMSSFGTLSVMYKLLKGGHARRQVARFYGLSDTVMASWLHSIVYVRNICAHHSRLWNRRLSINAIVPRRTQLPFIAIPKDTKRVYYALSIMLYLLQTVNPNNTFTARYRMLLDKYPHVNVSAMGFPADWLDQPLWNS